MGEWVQVLLLRGGSVARGRRIVPKLVGSKRDGWQPRRADTAKAATVQTTMYFGAAPPWPLQAKRDRCGRTRGGPISAEARCECCELQVLQHVGGHSTGSAVHSALLRSGCTAGS